MNVSQSDRKRTATCVPGELMPAVRGIARRLFWIACAIGKPLGGIRPRRIYRLLARVGFISPSLEWHRSLWGYELELSPYYHIDREILFAGCYEKPLHMFLRRHVRLGMTCLDIGANIGEIAIHMGVLVGQHGAVHAFEPAEYPRARLERNVARNKLLKVVRIHALALSNKNGESPFWAADAISPNQGLGSLVTVENQVTQCRRTVKCQTLDDFVHIHNVDSVDVVKVDIQGAECLFLQGAAGVLRRTRPLLLMEVSQSDLLCAGSSTAKLMATLRELGYSVHRLENSGLVGPRITGVEAVGSTFFLSSVVCVPQERDLTCTAFA